MSERTEAILAQMTLQEKIDMLAGADLWTTVPNERLNIPALKVSDGPNGVRGGQFGMGPTAACLPVGIAIGATWNPALVEEIGGLLADEMASKGASILLGPTINVHRSLYNGRNFECYTEDPWLSSRMTVAYVNGLQVHGVGACVKHFAANDSEFERYSTNSIVDERALREIYLPAFKAAVTEANVWAIMSGYNKVNGTWCSENEYLLKTILKEEWGFDGIVMSDWFGTYSPAIGNGGLDLEMPGPSRWAASLAGEVAEGRLAEADVDDKIRRLLYTLERAGKFENPEIPEEWADDRPEHRALLRRTVGESTVLLKNEGGLLPLSADKVSTIALIGGNARWPGTMGGGSATVPAHYMVTPLEGFAAQANEQFEWQYEVGAASHRMLPLFDLGQVKTASGMNGVEIAYYNGKALAGEPVGVDEIDRMMISLTGLVHEGLEDQMDYSVRVKTTFTAETSGEHQFSLVSGGRGRMFINGDLVIDNWDDYFAGVNLFELEPGEKHTAIQLAAGESAEIVMEGSSEFAEMMNMIRFGCLPPMSADPIGDAVKAAREADVAVVFVGTNFEWETEGFDQVDAELPGEQNALVAAVVAANPNTVVVLNTGTPKMLPWVDDVPALLQMWYPGQEGGHGITDVLFGGVDPSGRLPQTFPKRIQDNSAYVNYPGENGDVRYGEGIFVGYRYLEHCDIEPMFPFGHGLSYTTFAMSNLRLSSEQVTAGQSLEVMVDVTNTGDVAGQEVVQLYVHDQVSRLVRPPQELKGFAKVALAAGETQTVTLTLDDASFSYYDPALGDWVAESGAFEVRVGRSSADIVLTATIDFVNPADQLEIVTEGTYHAGLSIGMLLNTPATRDVLWRFLPDIGRAPTMLFAGGKPLVQFADENPHLIHVRLLAQINEALRALA